MMLVETNTDFFGSRDQLLLTELEKAVGTKLLWLNESSQQVVLFFTEETADWKETARRIYELLQHQCGEKRKCYVAVSSGIHDRTQLAERYRELELLMENRFYGLESRVFIAENEAESAEDVRLDDDTLIRQIRQDIRANDILSLKEHCQRLFLNCSKNVGFSQIYVKFMFAGLLKALCEAVPEKTEKEMELEMEALYKTMDLEEIHTIIQKNIGLLEEKTQRDTGSIHREVETVKRYIYEHYGEELSMEMLAEKVYLAPSYLSTIFKKETGQNLSKFIKACRMKKAKEMLENSHEKIVGISEKVGYSNVSYFCQSFREYYGISPQKFRDQGESVGEDE